MREAYRRTRKDAAPRVDEMTAKEYGEHLEENLRSLHERLISGSYRATAVKRVWLVKDDGRKRPVGIPIVEDKVAQRAVEMLLSAVYEQDFYDFSHGFREGHSPHQALHELREWCMENRVGWIVDADISGCFDNLGHRQIEEILKRRIQDGKLLRLISKWLNAGVLDGGEKTYPEKGTPQGGVISPLLANIFLHHVLDEWFVKEVKPRMRGRVHRIRFADDFVITCELASDAKSLMEVLPKRFGRFGLGLHPAKTRLITFQKPDGKEDGGAKPGTFDFLGFRHYWAQSRQGYWVIKRKTARKRLSRTLKKIWSWCRTHLHHRMGEQYRYLSLMLRGHYQYYGIRGNFRMLEVVLDYAEHAWRYWLSRRSQTSAIPWERFDVLRNVYTLPKPSIVHGNIRSALRDGNHCYAPETASLRLAPGY
ncbi:MAG: group II intron reverse transcriptase/maturase [Anaerolineales bacterium]